MAGGHFGGRDTCESCKSIDVRHWYREGRLADGQYFTWSWTCLGETSGTIEVRTECDAAVLRYRARGFLPPSGSPSNSACRLHGRIATLVAAGPGSFVPSVPTAGTVGGASRRER